MLTITSQHLRRPRVTVALALALGAALGLFALGYAASAAKPDPWPTFTMTYRTSQVNAGTPDEAPVSQTLRLVYVDQRHFTTILLDHSSVPAAAGWRHVVNGSSSVVTDPRLGTVQSATLDDLTVPDDWLVPGLRPKLAYMPGAVSTTLADGLARVSVTTSESGKVVIEEVTYRTSDGIPTLFTQTVDGRETRRAEVLDLHVGR